jgi:hypothetical protein
MHFNRRWNVFVKELYKTWKVIAHWQVLFDSVGVPWEIFEKLHSAFNGIFMVDVCEWCRKLWCEMKWDSVVGVQKNVTFWVRAERMQDCDVGNKGAARFLKVCKYTRKFYSVTSVQFYFVPVYHILHPVTANSHRYAQQLLRAIETWFCCYSSALDLFWMRCGFIFNSYASITAHTHTCVSHILTLFQLRTEVNRRPSIFCQLFSYCHPFDRRHGRLFCLLLVAYIFSTVFLTPVFIPPVVYRFVRELCSD